MPWITLGRGQEHLRELRGPSGLQIRRDASCGAMAKIRATAAGPEKGFADPICPARRIKAREGPGLICWLTGTLALGWATIY
jgi:hypothetical protein